MRLFFGVAACLLAVASSTATAQVQVYVPEHEDANGFWVPGRFVTVQGQQVLQGRVVSGGGGINTNNGLPSNSPGLAVPLTIEVYPPQSAYDSTAMSIQNSGADYGPAPVMPYRVEVTVPPPLGGALPAYLSPSTPSKPRRGPLF